VLREARREVKLSQRALALVAGVPQPTVARIESGAVTPRVDTLDRLLAACGRTLMAGPMPGAGVDRTQMRARRAPVLVASIEDLIRMKRAAGRPKDLIEVEVLGALQAEIDARNRDPGSTGGG
jgi:predicted transcriptional regulator